MKAKRWLFVALVTGGALVATRGCLGCGIGGKDPDEKLAAQFDDLCSIARSGVKDPVKGVKKLGRYLVVHTGDMMKNFGDTIMTIERIADDDKHDKRAERAREVMFAPLIACHDDWSRFGDAIEENEEAFTMVADAGERLNRTFEIIFGQARFTFRELPSQLQRELGLKLR